LLADDSITIQRVIKLTFADEDIEVLAVGDGNQAVEAIDRQPPDVVLADVAMPGRTGYEVAQHIRTSPGLTHIPVLLLTGAFEPIDEARASSIGCDGVFEKPFEPDAVVSRVKELLAKPRVAAKPVAAPAPAAIPTRAVAPAKALEPAAAPIAAEVASTAGPRQASPDVDAYFDRLDQAFATLALTPRASTDAQPAPADPVAASPFARATVPPASAPMAPAASVPSMALDDVFGALTVAGTPSAPSAPAPAPQPAAIALTDAQVEQIVNRVLERLTARLGNPAEIVANVVERVVREEIAQIKGRV
jgi:CheY-like chemotaxis protein